MPPGAKVPCPECSQEMTPNNLGRHRLVKHGVSPENLLGNGSDPNISHHDASQNSDVSPQAQTGGAKGSPPGASGTPETPSAPSVEHRGTSSPQAERRPSATGAKGKRRLFGGKARISGPDAPRAPQARPTAGRRVSTSPLTETILTFFGGGLQRVGQPVGAVMAFTSPVAGEIVDDIVAGTPVDRIVQPLVRGSEKWQNAGALAACYGSVIWATNVPESAEEAYALFAWSMTVLMPLQGKQMVKRQKDHQKAAEAMEEVMPELVKMWGPDPIRGMWNQMWAQPAPEPAPAEPAAV